MLPKITILPNKISKIGSILHRTRLPSRNKPAHLNFCVHAELIYDDKVYNALLKFSKNFRALTGVKLAACVATPLCPFVGESTAKTGVTMEEFSSRILELADFAEIGYHGHFYKKDDNGFVQLSTANYDEKVATDQITSELEWFKSIGIFPKIYVAGWWFLTGGIVSELERNGIEIDLSIRKSKEDTFGTKYMPDARLPDYGEPFFLPPSKNIIEIQSIFGPVMPPPLMKMHIAPFLSKKKEKELFFILSLHDWDVPRYIKNIQANIRELGRCDKTVGWMNIPDMRKHFMHSIENTRS